MIKAASLARISDRQGVGLTLLAIIIWALVMFHAVLPPDVVLFSTDNNIGNEGFSKARLPHGYVGDWVSVPLLGNGGVMTLNWTSVLLWLLPLQMYMNWVHALHLGLACLFLALFLRMQGCSWKACGMGWLAAFWLGTNFTLTYAGHTAKFGVLMFAAAALWCLELANRKRRVAWSLLAGGAVGGMFLEQQDVALFIGLFLGAYAVLGVVREAGWNLKTLAVRLIPVAIVAALVAGGTMLRVYALNVEGIANMGEQEDPQKKWEFCTQWSVPPDESVEFIAPGYMGWRSGDSEGPYWGRTGRSAGWEHTRQGFMNFRLESIYIGAIPVILALFALAAAIATGWKRQSPITNHQSPSAPAPRYPGTPARRHDILFWSIVAALALLLSFGKYFPLYALFYKLPMVSSIRNPNKFLHAFQLAVGILAAYGFDLAITCRREREGQADGGDSSATTKSTKITKGMRQG